MDNNLEFWMRGVLLSIIGVLGLIGNALFIYILWKKAKKSSIDFILIGMSLIAEINICSTKFQRLSVTKVNSLQEACAKCFGVHLLKFEFLQTT